MTPSTRERSPSEENLLQVMNTMKTNTDAIQSARQNNDPTTFINQVEIFKQTAGAFGILLKEYRENHSDFTAVAKALFPDDLRKQNTMAREMERRYGELRFLENALNTLSR